MSTPRHELLRSGIARLASSLKRLEKGEMSTVAPLRLGIRRLRELLPVLQLDSEVVGKVDTRLRKTARRLKPLVRIDALLAVTDELSAIERRSRQAETRMKNDLRRRRVKLGVPGLLKKTRTELEKVLGRLDAIAEELKGARESAVTLRVRRWAVKARAARRAVDMKRTLDDAGSVYLPGRLSALRRSTKRLLRCAELLGDAVGQVSATDLKTLGQMSDALDRLRDSETLIRRLRHLQGALTPPDIRVWQELDHLIVPLEHRCRRLHGRYVRDREALALAGDRLGARALASSPSKRKVS